MLTRGHKFKILYCALNVCHFLPPRERLNIREFTIQFRNSLVISRGRKATELSCNGSYFACNIVRCVDSFRSRITIKSLPSREAMEETEVVEVMPDVDLSSDSEEENEDEVSLIVLKRPELKKRQVEEIEVQIN